MICDRLSPVPGLLLHGFILVHRAGALRCCFSPFRANSGTGFSLESASISQKSIVYSDSYDLDQLQIRIWFVPINRVKSLGKNHSLKPQGDVNGCHHQSQRGKSNSTEHSPRDYRIEEVTSSPEAGVSLWRIFLDASVL